MLKRISGIAKTPRFALAFGFALGFFLMFKGKKSPQNVGLSKTSEQY
jgi:hypothetical protein